MTRAMALASLLAAIGCRPSAQEETPSSDRPAHIYTPDAAVDPVFDPELIEQALADFVAAVFDLQAQPALDAYDAAMALADDSCPSWFEYQGEIFWRGSCYTQAGAWFHGQGFFYAYEGGDINSDGGAFFGDKVSGTATVRDADGHTFNMGGFVYQGTGTTAEGDPFLLSHVGGSFSSDWPNATDTWLGADLAPLVRISVTTDAETGTRVVNVEGQIGGVSEVATAVEVEGMLLDESSGCIVEPTGTIGVRDPTGAWFDVQFGSPDDATDCDGCGVVTLADTEVGQACADFSPLLDWDESPW